MANICLVLTGSTVAENLAWISQYRDSIDLVELRVDLLAEPERAAVTRFPSKCPVPVICTVRRKSDGGGFDDGEAARVRLLERAAGAGYAFVDLESDFRVRALESAFSSASTRVIRSFHDFSGVPADLDGLYRKLSDNPEEIPKIAVNPHGIAEALRLAEASMSWGTGERIVLGMGTYGFFTRIIAEKLGSMLSFCSPAGTSAAPGHVDPDTLTRLYRYRNISAATRVFGVIGDPVMHSRSPSIHNPAFDAAGLDAVYLPFHVDEVEPFFNAWQALDVDGCSVTVPHKQAVIPLLARAESAVESIGSCNTVTRSGGSLSGMNTDAPGFLAAARRLFDRGKLPTKAAVIGAGGTARAVVYALVDAGVEVLVANRTPERAQALAERYGCIASPLTRDAAELIRTHADLLVQTTSAGMEPFDHLDPLEFYEFDGHETVIDVIYAPKRTRMLTRAEAAGCTVDNGWQMLLEQAYLQFEMFSGRRYPRDAVSLDQ